MPATSTLPSGNSSAMSSSAPVTDIGDAQQELRTKPALCLSGGGARRVMRQILDRISSVFGGTIVAARLGLAWSPLTISGGVATNFVKEVAEPIRKLASKTIDEGSILGGIFAPGSTISEKVIAAYDAALPAGRNAALHLQRASLLELNLITGFA